MPTATNDEFRFDEWKRLHYKQTTTTTDGSGAVTGVSVFRAVYPPTVALSDVPAQLATQCQLEWTAPVKTAYNDMLAQSLPGVEAQP